MCSIHGIYSHVGLDDDDALVDNHDNRNDPLLLAASVESHRRFAQWIAERHGIDATVYLAGAISAVRMHHLLAPYDVTTPSDSEERPT